MKDKIESLKDFTTLISETLIDTPFLFIAAHGDEEGGTHLFHSARIHNNEQAKLLFNKLCEFCIENEGTEMDFSGGKERRN